MGWHLQSTRLTARLFSASKSFENRDPPEVIAQVDLQADGSAYVHATMSRKDGSTPAGAWRELARMLRTVFGVTALSWEHKGRPASEPVGRAWADTVQVER